MEGEENINVLYSMHGAGAQLKYTFFFSFSAFFSYFPVFFFSFFFFLFFFFTFLSFSPFFLLFFFSCLFSFLFLRFFFYLFLNSFVLSFSIPFLSFVKSCKPLNENPFLVYLRSSLFLTFFFSKGKKLQKFRLLILIKTQALLFQVWL